MNKTLAVDNLIAVKTLFGHESYTRKVYIRAPLDAVQPGKEVEIS
jgi:hypothetical protein